MKEPRWLSDTAVRAIQAELVAEYGGPAGVRDDNLLGAALARPKHLLAYGKPTLFELAAAYGFALARNHPFLDGNKRMALAAIAVFLDLNGYELSAGELETVAIIRALASSDLDQSQLADWIKRNTRKHEPPRSRE